MNAIERRKTRFASHARFLEIVTGLKFDAPYFDTHRNAVVFCAVFIGHAPDGDCLPWLLESHISDPADLVK